MNNTFYGLSCNPFDKQALTETGFFESNDHKQMVSRLDYLKDVRGIGVFTASPGMGKSYALRCFQHSLNQNLYHMKYICLSTISDMHNTTRQVCQYIQKSHFLLF